MPNIASFNSHATLAGFTSGGVQSPAQIVNGRAAPNGHNPLHITGLYGYCAGHGASASVVMSLSGTATSSFTVAAGGSATGTGYKAISKYMADGASVTFRYDFGSSAYFGRGGAGTSTSDFGSFDGQLGASYEYVQVPSAPLSPAVTRSGSSATVTWSAPSDGGGSAITGYTVQASLSSSFTSPITVTTTGATTATVTGLTAASTYYFRVGARNELADHYSTTSPWSASISKKGGIGGHRWDATAEAEVALTVAMRWDATAGAEVPLTSAIRWDGTAGVEVAVS